MSCSATNIRVGEAFTKDRKSSAASSDGLVDMARRAEDKMEELLDLQVCVGRALCSSDARMGRT